MTLDLSNTERFPATEIRDFVDDMHDYHIVSLSKRPFDQNGLSRTMLENKHGHILRNLTNHDMWKIRDYCLYLIQIGAVNVKAENDKPSVPYATYRPHG